MSTAAVLGGGSWGTALALQLLRAGQEVRLWMRDAGGAARLQQERRTDRYLPGVELPAGLSVTADLAAAVAGSSTIVVAVPSEGCRALYRTLAGIAATDALLVSATKGIEIDTLQRMTEVAEAECPGRPVAVLSGPSFALEVARGHPTTVVSASHDAEVAERVQRLVSSRTFRVYASADVVGVELGGALKNVIAIASGVIDGLGFGSNTVAALVTRGLAEMTRLAVARGGRPDTLAGLAGLGDLVLTCTGGLSRNRQLGQALGRGQSLEQARTSVGMVAEGVRTTLAACALAEQTATEMPIAQQMRAVLYEGKPPQAAVEELMLRSLKRE